MSSNSKKIKKSEKLPSNVVSVRSGNYTGYLPTFKDVKDAAKRLKGICHRTPVLTSTILNQQIGAEVYFKCENFQRGGGLKFRGGYNAMSKLTPKQKKAGVVAYSSGNHATAIALSGKELGIKTTIVMPTDAPALKVAATKSYGGNIIFFDRFKEDWIEIATKLSKEKGLTIIPPYDHEDVVAGNGTPALELFEEVGQLDHLFVCVGGGGIISGCSLAAKAMSPNC